MLCLMFVTHFSLAVAIPLLRCTSRVSHTPLVFLIRTMTTVRMHCQRIVCVCIYSFRLSYFGCATFLTNRYQIACFFSFVAAIRKHTIIRWLYSISNGSLWLFLSFVIWAACCNHQRNNIDIGRASLVFIVSLFSRNNDASTQSNRAHICAPNPSSKHKLVSTWYFKLEIEKKIPVCLVTILFLYSVTLINTDIRQFTRFEWLTSSRWFFHEFPLKTIQTTHL